MALKSKGKEEILHLKVAYQWKSVHDVHHGMNDLCTRLVIERNEADAITMAATELMENAVKYGKSLPHCREIDFNLVNEGNNTLKIIVTNGVDSENYLGNLLAHINQLHRTKNSEKLYAERILELMNNPDCNSGQLGLYRIAYEGAFNINYRYKDKLLTIIASRRLYMSRL